ncbi:hypothetical protein MNV49_000766 [Pseudohyphozyma bogoriensis]|nr:hypothetical protein MNV49_000766 [Pseudohyphozyma bogoriensis]
MSLQTISANAPLEEIFAAIRQDGGVIVSEFLTPEFIDEMDRVLEPHWAGVQHGGYAVGQPWRKLMDGLIRRCPDQMVEILRNPVWNAIMKEFLSRTEEFAPLRYEEEGTRPVHTSYQLTVTSGCDLGPGAIPQNLHRDEAIYGLSHAEGSTWSPIMGCLIAATNFTERNGATMVVPGSHLWPQTRPAKKTDGVPAVMKKGSALFWLGSTYHGAGANVTSEGEPDCWRRTYGVFGSPDNMRQEENQYLAIPTDVAAKLPRDVLRTAGWGRTPGGIGWVDWKDPMEVVLGPAPEELKEKTTA